MTLNVSSAVGFIALIGVAIQNGVIMISHINNLRERGATCAMPWLPVCAIVSVLF